MSGFTQSGRAIIASLLLAAHPVAAQLDATLERARELVDSGQAGAAFELLEPELAERAGDPAYDYLFALAALDSGQVSQGVFALERVLSVDPDHPQARAELARGYLLLGELDNARAEFEAVKRENPPAEVAMTIDRYLAEIDRREGGPQGTSFRGFVAVTGGYDSNVNSAQDSSAVNVPLFAALSPAGDGTTQISAAGIERSDTFAQVSGGGSVTHRLGAQTALLANAAVTQRWNQSERNFDTGDGLANLGITWQRTQDRFTVALQGSQYRLDRNKYRNAVGVFGQWRRNLTPSSWASGYAQVTALSYDTQRIRNANRYTVGGVYSSELGGPYQLNATVGAYGGVEAVRASGVDQLGHRFVGVTAQARFKFLSEVSGFLNVSVESRDYGGTDPFFLVNRDDTFYRVGGGIVYEFTRRWNLIPQVYYSRNESNVALNEYDRVVLSLTLRRNFE